MSDSIPSNPQSQEIKKKPPVHQVVGGCFIIILFGVISLVTLVYSCTTPEERAQWEVERKAKEKPVAAAPSEYWSKQNTGSIPCLKVERFDDVESKGDVIRITSGRDRDYGIMFQIPASALRDGFTRKFLAREANYNGYFFNLSDGKNNWAIFDNPAEQVVLTVKNIMPDKKTIVFNISGVIRSAVDDPKSQSSFFVAAPGNETMSLDLDIVVAGENFVMAMQQNGDWKNLELGCVYRLEKVTVLCVAPQVSDPIEGIKQMRKIAAGCQIKITGAQLVGSTKWYLVEVYSRDAVTSLQPIATGWINSVGLVAQNLPLVNGGK